MLSALDLVRRIDAGELTPRAVVDLCAEAIATREGEIGAFELGAGCADHFAACLLMPKRWLKGRWFETQNVPALAYRLGVSSRALSVRLWHLGLAVDTPRCPRTSRPDEWPDTVRRYLRYSPSPLEAAA
jgi:hypothetical protein